MEKVKLTSWHAASPSFAFLFFPEQFSGVENVKTAKWNLKDANLVMIIITLVMSLWRKILLIQINSSKYGKLFKMTAYGHSSIQQFRLVRVGSRTHYKTAMFIHIFLTSS